MFKSKVKKKRSAIPPVDVRRRKRELGLIFIIIVVVALLTFVESRIIQFGADIPVCPCRVVAGSDRLWLADPPQSVGRLAYSRYHCLCPGADIRAHI